jgi:hypothetical protein
MALLRVQYVSGAKRPGPFLGGFLNHPDTSTAPSSTATTAIVRTLRNAYVASSVTLDTRTPGRVDSGVSHRLDGWREAG